MTKVPPVPPDGGNRASRSAVARTTPRPAQRPNEGARVLRFPFKVDPPETEAAKRIAARFPASGALQVVAQVVAFAKWKLSGDPPPLLARALLEAVRRLRDASALAELFESNPEEFAARAAEYDAAPSLEAVAVLASRPSRCATCAEAFVAGWPRCVACGRCPWCCECSDEPSHGGAA